MNLIGMHLLQTTKASPQNWIPLELILLVLRMIEGVKREAKTKEIPQEKVLIEKDVDPKEELKVDFSFFVILACNPSRFERGPQEPEKKGAENSSLREGYQSDCRAFLVDPCHPNVACDAIQGVAAIESERL